MTTLVKTHEAHEFLALVPQLAGFEPRNSVVLVAFKGKRTCAAIRFNLPISAPASALRGIATSIVGMLCKVRGADAVVPVVYTDERFGGGSGMPSRKFVEVLVSRAEMSGFTVRDALCVAGDGWGSYLDEKCPSEGRSLGKIAEAAHALPSAARRELRPVDDDAGLPPVDFATCERIARQLRRYRALTKDPLPVEEFSRELALLDDLPLFLECALRLDPVHLEEDLAALLIFCLTGPPIRDAAMMQWAFDLTVGDRALEENQRFQVTGVPETAGTGNLMWGEGPRPDPERITTAIALLKCLTARAPRSARPPLLCMIGWLNWALGKSSIAGTYVDLAEEIDPGYGLAEVLQGMLSIGRVPEWAFDVPDPYLVP